MSVLFQHWWFIGPTLAMTLSLLPWVVILLVRRIQAATKAKGKR